MKKAKKRVDKIDQGNKNEGNNISMMAFWIHNKIERGQRIMKKMQDLEKNFTIELGVKSDPIQYRYSFDWLFNLMAEEGIYNLQLGTFTEFYSLPDSYFFRLKESAQSKGIQISSIFTSHRELGGFLNPEKEYAEITMKNYRRMIEIAAILECPVAGSSMGSVYRDKIEYRPQGIKSFLKFIKDMMVFAKDHGLSWLTLEPMSCYAEPPCNSVELKKIADELVQFHLNQPEKTVRFGYCSDVSHGWANQEKIVIENNLDYFIASFPYLYEFHFKNTDSIYNSTFGFELENLERGIIDVKEVYSILMKKQNEIPVTKVIGYLEHPGPKFGRDYSDYLLDRWLRESLKYLKEQWAEWSAIFS
jgi:sugar phosphate isomerase/epimerase